jgi:hypothetical protein
MRLLRSRLVLAPVLLALLSAAGCNSSSATDNIVLGQVQVSVTDAGGNPVSGLNVDLLLTDKATVWRRSLTSADGKAEFGAAEGGVILQNYIVRLTLGIQYSLATNETNDKPVTPVADQLTTVEFHVVKTTVVPPA